MFEVILKGKFECKNADVFLEGLNKLLQETNTTFYGQAMKFEVLDFDDYEEIDDNEKKTDPDSNI